MTETRKRSTSCSPRYVFCKFDAMLGDRSFLFNNQFIHSLNLQKQKGESHPFFPTKMVMASIDTAGSHKMPLKSGQNSFSKSASTIPGKRMQRVKRKGVEKTCSISIVSTKADEVSHERLRHHSLIQLYTSWEREIKPRRVDAKEPEKLLLLELGKPTSKSGR